MGNLQVVIENMGNIISKIGLLNLQRQLCLPHPLRPYQWDGVSFLVNNSSCLLSDEMGLGKTVQVSVALEILYRMNQLGRVLIIVPSSLKMNWYNELSSWSNLLPVQQVRGSKRDRYAYYRLPITILIASYEEVRLDAFFFVNKVDFDIVIIDEAQRIKNPNSDTALSCKIIQKKRSWAITGTPIENNVNDLVSIFAFVQNGLIHKALPKWEIHNRIRPHFLRRKKSEVAQELPPIIEQEIPLLLTGFQRETYEQVLYDKVDSGEEHSYGDLLAKITELKQICNYDYETGKSSKFDVLGSIIEEHFLLKKKIIIFSQYVKTLKWISSLIQNIPHAIYYGDLNNEKREEIIQKFRNREGLCVLLISLKAGGVGLNIQEAQTVVLFDRWWNPAVENQAIQRAHRLGREEPLHVIKFLVMDTIEEKISEIISNKQDIFDEYIEAAENAQLTKFSIETLRSILGITIEQKVMEDYDGENH